MAGGKIVVLLVVGLVISGMLGGCRSGEDVPKPEYTPVPDSELYDQVAALDGVIDVDVRYKKSFTEGSVYSGTVEVGDDADPAAVLDRTFAVLRQGRYRAAINVVALKDNVQTSSDAFGLPSQTDADLTQRYGPQPGDGRTPTTGP